jgi:cytochrome c553
MLQSFRRLLGVLAILLVSGCTVVQSGSQSQIVASSLETSLAERLDTGFVLTSSCSGCHAEGNARIKPLAGYTAAELQRLLTVYRTDVSGATAMHRMARGFSDAEIALIARELGE